MPIQIVESSSALISPTWVKILAGNMSANFTINTTPLAAVATRPIQVKSGGLTLAKNITINPATLSSLGISPNNIMGGTSTTGTVTLNGAAAGAGKSIALSDNSSSITVPASTTVAAGQTSKTFVIQTLVVTATATRQVYATADSITRSANLTIYP